MATPEQVVYPPSSAIPAGVIVEQLGRDEAIQLAPAVLGLIVDAYSAQFEGSGRMLPPGVFAATYGTDAALKRFQEGVIPHVYNRGGMYLGIRTPNRAGLIGVLKATSGDVIETPEQDGRFAGMVAIDEVLVDPEDQRKGHGATLLHAYLGNFAAQGARVVLEAFVGSSVNHWYRRLGFQPERPAGRLDLSNDHSLALHFHVTPEEVVVATIAQRLKERHPNLANGRAVYLKVATDS